LRTQPHKEIGTFPITLTHEGLGNDKFAHFGRSLDAGHWHSDMPGLTPGATLIAYSEGCPRQIVEYSKLVYGFQCHNGVQSRRRRTSDRAYRAGVGEAFGHKYVRRPDDLRESDYSQMNEALFAFLDKLSYEYEISTANDSYTDAVRESEGGGLDPDSATYWKLIIEICAARSSSSQNQDPEAMRRGI